MESEEVSAMKLNYQKFKEDSIYYEGLTKKMVRAFLKSVPKNLLIDELKSMKIIKRNLEIK